MADAVDISVLAPCLNEADNIVAIGEAIKRELAAAQVTYEIIFIDNCSTDNTVDLIKGMCAVDPRIRLIVNNRNYGQMRSPTYGIYQTSGRAVIGISTDFQDPPEMIGEFIARWRAGAHIVLAVRRYEATSLHLKMMRAVGYGFFSRFADYRVIPGATGFGLYDRAVVDCLKRWRDPEPFFRGMLVESGFPIETIPYDRPARAGGVTKNNIRTLVAFAFAGLASSSKRLLRMPFYASLFVGLGGFAACFLALWDFSRGYAAWGVVGGALTAFGFSLIFLFLGLMGEQIRVLSEIARNVPLVVERERVNFPTTEP